MYDYKLLLNHVNSKYKLANRHILNYMLPILTFENMYLNDLLKDYVKTLSPNILIDSFETQNEDLEVDYVYLEQNLIYDISLAVNIDPLVLQEDIGNDVYSYIATIVQARNQIVTNLNIKHSFSARGRSFNLLIDDNGYLDKVHHIKYCDNSYMVIDEYLF